MSNVFACLVHERRDAVVDLVANLTHLDADSQVLLYDGGTDPTLLGPGISVGGRDVLVHPSPTPQAWGRLHGFAVDCMRFALETTLFETLTIVDSDQLLIRRGYSAALSAFLADRPGVGMLASASSRQPRETRVAVAAAAWREAALWQGYCRRFESGEEKFPHWTFWPSTVFTAAACRDLVRTFDEDEELARVLAVSRLWATEEIVLPTLVALHGHEIAQSPFSYDLVRYRVVPTPRELPVAMSRSDVFWIHPVPRDPEHAVRRAVRDSHDGYREHRSGERGVLRTLPILERVRAVDGWLGDDEADLLVSATARALADVPDAAVVEIGSFCGKGTVVLGTVVRTLGGSEKVYAIDPHDGWVGARDQQLHCHGSTRERFDRTVAGAGLAGLVVPVQERAWEVDWKESVSLLVVDGLHDYESVERDFRHFEPWLAVGGYVAFHDYADYFPGVQRFVDDLLAGGGYEHVAQAGSMVLLRKPVATKRRRRAKARRDPVPLVSCVMATHDRAHLVPQAVESFLRQDHPAIELIVVDDGPMSLEDVLPDDERVRHIRLDRRQTIGAKRNLGCEAARGDLLANWDDDDWYAPWRLTYQAKEIAAAGMDVCGLNRLLYLQPVTGRAWRYTWPASARPWVHDAVLLFTRDFWRRNPFPDTSMGIDCRLLWTSSRKRILALPDERFYVGMIHGGNTSPKNTRHGLWRECPAAEVIGLVGEDVAFYREALAGGGHAVAAAAR